MCHKPFLLFGEEATSANTESRVNSLQLDSRGASLSISSGSYKDLCFLNPAQSLPAAQPAKAILELGVTKLDDIEKLQEMLEVMHNFGINKVDDVAELAKNIRKHEKPVPEGAQ